MPGPYSYKSYLLAMLEDGLYGGQLMLVCLAEMWSLRLSVVKLLRIPNRPSVILSHDFRHNDGPRGADLCLFFNGVDHYSAASKFLGCSFIFD